MADAARGPVGPGASSICSSNRAAASRILEACRDRKPSQKIVVFSNYATREMRMRCAELGVDAVFDKSTEIDCLLAYCLTQSRKLDPAANDDSRDSQAAVRVSRKHRIHQDRHHEHAHRFAPL